jgi:hypothetical protein
VTLHADRELFISFANALFVVQRLDLLGAMLQDRHGYARPLRLLIGPTGGPGFVRWEVTPERNGGEHCFTFDPAVFSDDRTRLEVLAFHWEFPLFSHYASAIPQEAGALIINRGDIGAKPGLAYCDNRPDYFLIPDPQFVSTHGHALARETFRKKATSWADRKPVAFWRGSTTGIRHGTWHDLPRAKLCAIAQRHEEAELFDVGFSAIVQWDVNTAAEIEGAGMMRVRVPWHDWDAYKLHIDIDGNSNAWAGFFQRLLTGSPVLKVESPRGFVQWYYHELRPWHNYVPITPDMSDLADKVRWLLQRDSTAQEIGKRGRELAERLSYEHELDRGAATIAAAFRHFSGREAGTGPFGRATNAAPLLSRRAASRLRGVTVYPVADLRF